MNTTIAQLDNYRAFAPRDLIADYEQWLAKHQGVDAAQVELIYKDGWTCLHVFLATDVGRDRTDVQWLPGDHRANPQPLIDASRMEFVGWYTRKGIRDVV